MKRLPQLLLIASTLVASWFGMQAVHEFGHVLGAWLTGGEVAKVVLHPFTISRTDLALNPQPLLVVWAGPVFGVLLPLVMWAVANALRWSGTFVLRFFAGFCLIANGGYIAIGSFDKIGDCREMLLHGSSHWHLWLFGRLTCPLGFWLWHQQGTQFGLGDAQGKVSSRVAYTTACASLMLLLFAWWVDGK